MSGPDLLFWVFAIATAGCAVAVVLAQSVVRMAFWLILSLGSTAGLFFLLNADFIGAAQLLVYVGGTLVLLIFGVMLTASGPFLSMKTSPGEAVLSGFLGFALLALIYTSVCSTDWQNVGPPAPRAGLSEGFNDTGEGNTTRPLGMSLLGLRPDKDLGARNTVLSSGYLLPFEIASVHLLVVLIGAAYLARAKRRKPASSAAGAASPEAVSVDAGSQF